GGWRCRPRSCRWSTVRLAPGASSRDRATPSTCRATGEIVTPCAPAAAAARRSTAGRAPWRASAAAASSASPGATRKPFVSLPLQSSDVPDATIGELPTSYNLTRAVHTSSREALYAHLRFAVRHPSHDRLRRRRGAGGDVIGLRPPDAR